MLKTTLEVIKEIAEAHATKRGARREKALSSVSWDHPERMRKWGDWDTKQAERIAECKREIEEVHKKFPRILPVYSRPHGGSVVMRMIIPAIQREIEAGHDFATALERVYPSLPKSKFIPRGAKALYEFCIGLGPEFSPAVDADLIQASQKDLKSGDWHNAFREVHHLQDKKLLSCTLICRHAALHAGFISLRPLDGAPSHTPTTEPSRKAGFKEIWVDTKTGVYCVSLPSAQGVRKSSQLRDTATGMLCRVVGPQGSRTLESCYKRLGNLDEIVTAGIRALGINPQ
jgi:sulfur relay (sulfurtransferase) DsrC/TusE family protein